MIGGIREGAEVDVETFPASTERTVRAGATGVDFVIEDSLVRVEAVDESGRPLLEATCTVAEEGRTSTAGGDGDPFVVLPVRPGRPFVVLAECRGHVPARVERAPATPRPVVHVVRLVLHAAPPTRLPLRVVRADGTEVPAAELAVRAGVWARGRMRGRMRGRRVVEDVGVPGILDLPPVPHRVRVFETGRPLLAAERTIDVVPGENPLAEFRLPRGVALVVRCGTDVEGLSLRDGRGRLVGCRFVEMGRSGGSVRWGTLFRLAPGRYVLTARRGADERTREIHVDADPTVVDWRE